MNIVISGASRGIGFETARRFSESGEHRIFVLSRDENGLKKLAETASGVKNIIVVPCDLEEEKSVLAAVLKIKEKVSGVDVLINNSGRLVNKPFMELTDEDWKHVYGVNVFGVVRLTRALMPLLLKGNISGNGKIKSHVVNISSMGGVQGSMKFRGLSAYSSSKGALITLTECLSEEMREEGVRVNCVALGSVETEMFREAFPGMGASMSVGEVSGWLTEFALSGYKFFNGKIIPVSTSTP